MTEFSAPSTQRAVQTGRALPWTLALLAVASGAAAWWYFAPQSLPHAIQTLAPMSPKAMPTLYKWHDAKGQLHVTDVPPTDRPYEAVRYDPNTNVVPTVVPPPPPKN